MRGRMTRAGTEVGERAGHENRGGPDRRGNIREGIALAIGGREG